MTAAVREYVDFLQQMFPRAAWMNIAAGVGAGFVLGAPPMLIYFQGVLSDCVRATSQEMCLSVSPSTACKWDATHGACFGGDVAVCDPRWAPAQCSLLGGGRCGFNLPRNQCEQVSNFGWSSGQEGLFASANVMGALVGSLIATATPRADQMRRIRQFAVVLTVGAMLSWGMWIVTGHAWYCALGFFVSGIGFGGAIAIGPAVVSAVIDPGARALAGSVVQLCIMSGIFVCALLALAFGSLAGGAFAPHVLFLAVALAGAANYYVADAVLDPIVAAYDLVAATSTMRSGGAGGAASERRSVVVGEAPVDDNAPPVPVDGPPGLAGGGGGNNSNDDNNNNNNGGRKTSDVVISDGAAGLTTSSADVVEQQRHQQQPPDAASTCASTAAATAARVRDCYIAGFITAAALQAIGANAIIAFAPRITLAAGIESPLIGNAVVMLVNWLSCVPAIPALTRFPPQTMFLWGLGTAACASVATAVALGMGSPILTLLCACVFLACFEIGIGSPYYCLMTMVFPPEMRQVATSRVNVVNFGFNIVVAYSFPVLCDWLAPAGDASGGVRRVFLLYAACGVACLGALWVMFPRSNVGRSVTVAGDPQAAGADANAPAAPPETSS